MNIGIIGKGNVGGTLGRAWATRGHDVLFGIREPQSPAAEELLRAPGATARAGSVADAAAFGEVVVLAVPWSAAREAIENAGDLSGKVLVDATNPLAPGVAGLEIGHTTSAGEEIARWAAGARVVKAFNSTGAENMADPQFGSERVSMFYCGDDDAAKAVVAGLGKEIGFDMVDAGPLASARLLEPLAMLWVTLAYRQGMGRNIAFKLLTR